MPDPRLTQTLRTSKATDDAVRALAGAMTSRLHGTRITQDVLIGALVALGNRHPGELAGILRGPTNQEN